MRSVAIAVCSVLAADAYARMSATGDDFNTPDLGTASMPIPALDVDTPDEFTAAILESKKPVPVAPVPVRPKGPGKYQLDYVLNGKRITETHDTLRKGLDGVRRLNSLGIAHVASTNKDAPAPVADAPAIVTRSLNPAHTWNVKPALRTDGPTLSQWIEAGYSADTYPPEGYAAVPEPVQQA